MTPIQLYSYQTPNGHKASIMLEETGLPYEVHLVDIENDDQFRPGFLALNPNNKIPVIVDRRSRTVFESGAILLYLAARSGVLKPRNETEAGLALQKQIAAITVEQIFDEGLHEFLTRFIGDVSGLGLRIHENYLSGDVR